MKELTLLQVFMFGPSRPSDARRARSLIKRMTAPRRAWTVAIGLLCGPCVSSAKVQTNQLPIVGVLALPVEDAGCESLERPTTNGGTSCFQSLYVKWLEAAGARVVPLPYDLPEAAFEKLVGSLNGALITGGGTDLSSLSSPYMQAAGRLYEWAQRMHACGECWPLWGTCMGMQVLSVLGARSSSVLLANAYDSEGLYLPLRLTPAAASSKLLCASCLPSETLLTLTTSNATVNLHHDGVAPDSFAPNTTLGAAFKLLSTNEDRRGRRFASSIEAASGAPIFGVQWHPERPQFEWPTGPGDKAHFFPRSAAEIRAMFDVAARFVYFARMSGRRFASARDEAAALIYNYQAVGTTSYQAYYFSAADPPAVA
jgi:gamma-glutamyl hydrolase